MNSKNVIGVHIYFMAVHIVFGGLGKIKYKERFWSISVSLQLPSVLMRVAYQ